MHARKIIWGTTAIGAIVLIAISIYLKYSYSPPEEALSITNFEECKNAGYPIMESYPEQCNTPNGMHFVREIKPIVKDPNPQPTPISTTATSDFDRPLTYRIGETKTYTDGLTVTLKEINDSRCKEGVQCIWAGELSLLFFISDATTTSTSELRIGTVNNKIDTHDKHVFKLESATENTAQIIVSKNDTSFIISNMGKVTGHVTIGPICPTESIERPCTVPSEVYTSRKAVIYAPKDQVILAESPLDKNGNYEIDMLPGIFRIQIQPAGIGPGEMKKVVVEASKTVTVDFDIDTGIR